MKTLQLSESNKQLLQAVVESVSTGLTIGEVRKSIKILDLLQQPMDIVILEDSDFSFLYTKFNGTKFMQIHKEILDVADILEAASK